LVVYRASASIEEATQETGTSLRHNRSLRWRVNKPCASIRGRHASRHKVDRDELNSLVRNPLHANCHECWAGNAKDCALSQEEPQEQSQYPPTASTGDALALAGQQQALPKEEGMQVAGTSSTRSFTICCIFVARRITESAGRATPKFAPRVKTRSGSKRLSSNGKREELALAGNRWCASRRGRACKSTQEVLRFQKRKAYLTGAAKKVGAPIAS